MTIPFIKKDNSGLWVAAVITGAVAAAALAWLYFYANSAGDELPEEDHATDYLKPRPAKRKQTTDLNELRELVTS